MSEYEIDKTLVLSTAHIPESEGELLEAAGDDCGALDHVVYNYAYGWRIWVPLGDESLIGALNEVPYTKKLVKLALSLDCQWLRLDQDGPCHDHLPQHPLSHLEQLAECAENEA